MVFHPPIKENQDLDEAVGGAHDEYLMTFYATY
jgi:hypothetical protein